MLIVERWYAMGGMLRIDTSQLCRCRAEHRWVPILSSDPVHGRNPAVQIGAGIRTRSSVGDPMLRLVMAIDIQAMETIGQRVHVRSIVLQIVTLTMW